MSINKPIQLLPSKINFEEIYKFNKKILKDLNIYSGTTIIHDGPPYANGDIHIGTFLNKYIKDVIARYYLIQKKSIHYIPGWDCHGLPIENNVIKKNEKKNNNIKEDNLILRGYCEKYADEYIKRQKEQMQEYDLLIYEEHYETKSKEYIIQVIKTLFSLVGAGLISKKLRPNYFSIEEQSNLAFSEIEYHDIEYTSLYYLLPINGVDHLYLLIWTTQAWTCTCIDFVCINSEIQYSIFRINHKQIIASRQYILDNNIKNYINIDSSWIVTRQYINPFTKRLNNIYIDNQYVHDKEGSGILHCSPAHGFQDYQIAYKNREKQNIDIKNGIDFEGNIIFGGKHEKKINILLDGNNQIINILYMKNLIWSEKKAVHRYPVSWRSKKPVYILSSNQIILNISKNTINQIIEETKKTNWLGKEGGNSFISCLKTRDEDWCLSRQRKWGIPIMLFYNKKNNSILYNQDVNQEIIKHISLYNCDFWFNESLIKKILLKYNIDQEIYIPVKDTLDIWFESGCSFIFLKEKYKEKIKNIKQANYYSEGRDQIRGWLSTSAIIYFLINNILPFSIVNIHGFIKNEQNEKISKSNLDSINNNNINILNPNNKDILKMLFFMSDTHIDIIISDEKFAQAKQTVLKIYNLLRYYVNISYLFSSFDKPTKKTDYYYISKFQSEIKSFFVNTKQLKTSIAYQNIIKMIQLYSEFIRVSKDDIYCNNVYSYSVQNIINTLKIMFLSFCKVCYIIIPSLIIYILSNLYKKNSESEILTLLQNHNIKSFLEPMIEKKISIVYEIYQILCIEINKLLQNKEIIHSYELKIIIITNQIKIDLLEEEEIEKIFNVSKIRILDLLYNKELLPNNLLSKFWFKNSKILITKIIKYYKCFRCWKYTSAEDNKKCYRCSNVK